MMVEPEEGESEVFEIVDFVNATEWERFVAKLEEVIREWKLESGCLIAKSSPKQIHKKSVAGKEKIIRSTAEVLQGGWSCDTVEINFADFLFDFSHYTPNVRCDSIIEDGRDAPRYFLELMDAKFDFPARAHCLTRWYGTKQFLILSPGSSSEAITTESKTNLLLSSVSIALANSKCHIPIFIQIQQRLRRFFVGTCIGGGFRTSFEMINLRRGPPQCNHISGLLDMFKAKLNCTSLDSISIAVRFTYILSELNTCGSWLNKARRTTVFNQDAKLVYSTLPLLPLEDPVGELHLAVTWPKLSEELVVDNEDYSDLDPISAPLWSLRARLNESCETSLHQYLKSYLALCQTSQSTQQIMRSLSKPEDENELSGDISLAFARLTDTTPTITQSLSSVVSKAASGLTKSNLDLPPIPDDVLNELLQLLFPDSLLDETYAASLQKELASEQQQLESEWTKVRKHCRRLKSVPEHSLTSLLALIISYVHYNYGGIQAVAYLWHEFILELRFRLEHNILVPRLATGPPNLNFCLIHQKLQIKGDRKLIARRFHDIIQYVCKLWMLNYCIVQRQQRNRSVHEEANLNSPSGTLFSRNEESDDCQSDDEFYETVEQLENESQNECRPCSPSGTLLNTSSQREGVLRETEMMLLGTKNKLCIPITQDPSPMTEDMLEEQANVLTRLGTSAEDSRIRAQMQSASLLSDMEAFKAANPNCNLGDFVRWYSPNDWVEGPRNEGDIEELKKMKANHKKRQDGLKVMVAHASGDWEIDDDDAVTEDDLEGLTNDDDDDERSTEEGHLSLRMCIPGNIWQEVWVTAKTVPVRRQKRLFDDTKESEKVLHFLSRLIPADVALQLFPVIIDSAVARISHAADETVSVSGRLSQILRNCVRLIAPCHSDLPFLKEVVNQLHLIELDVWRHFSLQSKLTSNDGAENEADLAEVSPFIESLLDQPEVDIIGCSKSTIGKALLSIVAKQQENASPPELSNNDAKRHQIKSSKISFPLPNGREYIFRTSVPRPAASSRVCPQRMFAVITEDDFRVAGAFTKDTNFQ